MKKQRRSIAIDNSRRGFLGTTALSVVAGVVAGAAPFLARADDLPHLSVDDPTAKALGYTENSAAVDETKYPTHKAGMACANCNFYQGGSAAFGACPLYSGKAVNAKGWCSGYAKKP